MPALVVQVAHGHVIVERRLKSGKPVAEDRKPKLGEASVVILDDVGHADEGVVVVVENLLVLRIFEVALSHGVHVVKAEVAVLSLEESVDRCVPGHNVGQVESVCHFSQAPDSGSGECYAKDDRCNLDRSSSDPVSVVTSREPGKGPLSARFSDPTFSVNFSSGFLFSDQISRRSGGGFSG